MLILQMFEYFAGFQVNIFSFAVTVISTFIVFLFVWGFFVLFLPECIFRVVGMYISDQGTIRVTDMF